MVQKQEYHLLLGSVCFESSSREKRNVRILLFSRFFVSHLYMMFTEKYATATTTTDPYLTLPQVYESNSVRSYRHCLNSVSNMFLLKKL